MNCRASFHCKEVISWFTENLTLVTTINSTDLQQNQVITYDPYIGMCVNTYIGMCVYMNTYIGMCVYMNTYIGMCVSI